MRTIRATLLTLGQRIPEGNTEDLAAEYDVEITTDVQLDHPARAILDRADDFDAVVIGSHGGSLVDQLVVGNVAQKVFRNPPVPVIVIR